MPDPVIVDLEVVAEWIHQRTGVPVETIILVLAAETAWMEESGLIVGDDDANDE